MHECLITVNVIRFQLSSVDDKHVSVLVRASTGSSYERTFETVR